MTRTLLSTIAAGLLALPAHAQMIAPADVPWEDGVAIPVSLSGTPGDVDNGRILMNKGAGNCIACHGVTELSNLQFHGNVGPILDGVADRYSEAELRGIVANAKNWFPDTMMPAFYKTSDFIRLGNAYTGKAHEGDVAPLLTAQEIEDLVSFLVTLKE